jgi:hypothetical protein
LFRYLRRCGVIALRLTSCHRSAHNTNGRNR